VEDYTVGSKTRGNYPVSFCLKSDCVNRDFSCQACIKFSHYSNQELNIDLGSTPTNQTISSCSQQGPVVDAKGNRQVLSSYQKNELYRKARDLKEQIAKGMCSIRETKQPTEKNVNKMLNSEFKLASKMTELRKSMEAIGADPKDYNTEKLRRR
jgi:hypothetical protein